jgi:hypothetical protein
LNFREAESDQKGATKTESLVLFVGAVGAHRYCWACVGRKAKSGHWVRSGHAGKMGDAGEHGLNNNNNTIYLI